MAFHLAREHFPAPPGLGLARAPQSSSDVDVDSDGHDKRIDINDIMLLLVARFNESFNGSSVLRAFAHRPP